MARTKGSLNKKTNKKNNSLPELPLRKKKLGRPPKEVLDFHESDPIVVLTKVSAVTENTEEKPQRDAKGCFLPGNKVAKTARNPYRRILDKIPGETFDEVLQVVINKCRAGCNKSIDLLWKYLIPIPLPDPEIVEGIKTSTATELAASMDIVIGKMNEGDLSPEGAINYLKCLTAKRDFISAAFLEDRLNALDGRIKNVEKK